jgi:hypothetical protein
MTIAMTQDKRGIWTYLDQEQSELVTTVWALTGWDMSSFDSWINEDSHWVDYPEIRRDLILHRNNLTHCYQQNFHHNELIQVYADKLFYIAQASRLLMANRGRAIQLHKHQVQRQTASTMPRPRAKSEFKQAVLDAMRTGGDHQEFKSFMQMWRLGHINGLTVKSIEDGEKYVITDENGDLESKEYKWGSLATMFSEANNS